jgi:hypothetical protein
MPNLHSFSYGLNRLSKRLFGGAICLLALTSSSNLQAHTASTSPVKTKVKICTPCTLYININTGAYFVVCPTEEPDRGADFIPAPETGWKPAGPIDTPGYTETGPYYGPVGPFPEGPCPEGQTCLTVPQE